MCRNSLGSFLISSASRHPSKIEPSRALISLTAKCIIQAKLKKLKNETYELFSFIQKLIRTAPPITLHIQGDLCVADIF